LNGLIQIHHMTNLHYKIISIERLRKKLVDSIAKGKVLRRDVTVISVLMTVSEVGTAAGSYRIMPLFFSTSC
jgi:hypothetical protein